MKYKKPVEITADNELEANSKARSLAEMSNYFNAIECAKIAEKLKSPKNRNRIKLLI